jgi:hypothetical protein
MEKTNQNLQTTSQEENDNGLTYHREADYLLPDLTLPKRQPLGKYGRLRRAYLREHKNPIYTGMLLRGTLEIHLTEIDRRSTERVDLLIHQMAMAEGVMEERKASDQMDWVRKMNRIQSQAEEQVLAELIWT